MGLLRECVRDCNRAIQISSSYAKITLLLISSSRGVRGHRAVLQQQQNDDYSLSSNEVEAIKVKIIAHPQYSDLLEAYMDCQRVGASSEVVDRLSVARQEFEALQSSAVASGEIKRPRTRSIHVTITE